MQDPAGNVVQTNDAMLYPIGIQNFESLRKRGCVYVDKTEKIHRLVSTGKYYLLIRPRRFGKSLLVSAIKSYMEGQKKLFRGLALERLETQWAEHPILHLDFVGKWYNGRDSLTETLEYHLERWEEEYSVRGEGDHGTRFQRVIDAAYSATGRQVVILIDEYDKPMTDNLGNPGLLEHFRRQMQDFYDAMKAKDGCIRLAFFTGVARIGGQSVFSGLDSLRDISLDPEYSDICGISGSDIMEYFPEAVRELASAEGISIGECLARLKDKYDGYHFSKDSEGMYNPVSLLNTFANNRLDNYWFLTGSPDYLMEVMQRTSFDITKLTKEKVDAIQLGCIDTEHGNPTIPLLYQSGYLTIKGYDGELSLYHLGFPNREVKTGLLDAMFLYYIPVSCMSGMVLISKLARAAWGGRPGEMMKLLEGLFARANYPIEGDPEKDFQDAMYIIFELLGEYVNTEYQTGNGRIDILLQTEKYIYIIEMKADGSADEALGETREKGYFQTFADDKRRVYRIGVNFSKESRRITGWKVEQPGHMA